MHVDSRKPFDVALDWLHSWSYGINDWHVDKNRAIKVKNMAPDWPKWTAAIGRPGQWGDEVAALLIVSALEQHRPLYVYDADAERLVHVWWTGQDPVRIPIVLRYGASHYDAWHIDAGVTLPEAQETITDFRPKGVEPRRRLAPQMREGRKPAPPPPRC